MKTTEELAKELYNVFWEFGKNYRKPYPLTIGVTKFRYENLAKHVQTLISEAERKARIESEEYDMRNFEFWTGARWQPLHSSQIEMRRIKELEVCGK